MVKVYAPASSANMSVGFDVLGAAVTPVDGALLGDVVTVEAAETFGLNNLGRFADKLPSEPRENIVYQCWERFCQELGKQIPVAMTLEKNMPIGSRRYCAGKIARASAVETLIPGYASTHSHSSNPGTCWLMMSFSSIINCIPPRKHGATLSREADERCYR